MADKFDNYIVAVVTALLNGRGRRRGESRPTNCPNCDAVLSYEGGLHCEYCGARFEEPDKSGVTEFKDWTGRVVYTMAD